MVLVMDNIRYKKYKKCLNIMKYVIYSWGNKINKNLQMGVVDDAES